MWGMLDSNNYLCASTKNTDNSDGSNSNLNFESTPPPYSGPPVAGSVTAETNLDIRMLRQLLCLIALLRRFNLQRKVATKSPPDKLPLNLTRADPQQHNKTTLELSLNGTAMKWIHMS